MSGGTRSVTATFTGTPDPVAGADYYINRGTATHVAIAMREAGSGILKGNGSSMTEYVASDRTAKMAMQAAVISTEAGRRPAPSAQWWSLRCNTIKSRGISRAFLLPVGVVYVEYFN